MTCRGITSHIVSAPRGLYRRHSAGLGGVREGEHAEKPDTKGTWTLTALEIKAAQRS